MDNIALETAKHLLSIQAVQLSPEKPYQWASGWLSPIYCDNRKILAYPHIRDYIAESMVITIKQHYDIATVDVIAGVATGAIAIGVLVAEKLQKPFVYVRPEPKSHGMGNQIEGKLTEKQRVLVIEDLISTGGSSLKAVEALRKHNTEVLGMVAIFTYQFQSATDNFNLSQCQLHTLSNYSVLLEQAVHQHYIDSSFLPVLEKWRINPAQYGTTK